MTLNKLNTRKALNPAYRKHKPIRKDVNNFIEQLKSCIQTIELSDENNESEEHLKEPIKEFFKNTFYSKHLINTKDRIDLAIYTGETIKSDVAVIIEAKRPSNKSEFLSSENLNKKALHELLLYYLRERIDLDNNNIKHLIATNGYEWFLFKGEDFYKYFFKNKALIKEYQSFKDGLKDSTKNELFYNDIAKKYISEVEDKLPFVHLNFTKSDFDKFSDASLNTLFKIFSNVHILGHSFGNDSNLLNQSFYNELLHIIGLEEVKEKGKKVIQRKSEKDRDYASLLENTIFILEDRDHLSNVTSITGTNKAFEVGLELCLTWINRILFLKLLESQLLSYHKSAKEYRFLNTEFVDGFDELNNLFFSALAKNIDERHPKFKDKYQFIPYLNSSLFERNEIESETFEISALNDDKIDVSPSTVLKDAKGKRLKGKMNTLEYLFKFLDAYDFATDGTEGISDEQETKSLINASVLGLIFEKINGYKEGSFYTPAFITMYMCRETLRKAVVKKFQEKENPDIETFDDLKAYCHRFFKQEDVLRFNDVINSLKICDPAVGSGHFLVSALNELISIKSDLGILVDAKGFPLKCELYIENDELYITDSQLGLLFEYNPKDKESVRIQHTLFHEKQTIIENCLFGVDINPNSVKICRLRLWIELLKNAYYTKENQLQTLPNIDINIKSGNSLISRFSLDDDLKDAFKGKDIQYTFRDYKEAVEKYKNTNDKGVKKDVLNIINEVKNNFKSSLDTKFKLKVIKAHEAYNLKAEQLNNLKLFNEKISKAEKDKLKQLKVDADKASEAKKEIENNVIYHNAFEWRFEFPEILDEEGKFIGFDTIIGNPPYVNFRDIKNTDEKSFLINQYSVSEYQSDLFILFIERSFQVLSFQGNFGFIIPNSITNNLNNSSVRKFLLDNSSINNLINTPIGVFPDATVDTVVLTCDLPKSDNSIIQSYDTSDNKFIHFGEFEQKEFIENENFYFDFLTSTESKNIIKSIEKNSVSLDEITDSSSGIKEYETGKGNPPQTVSDRENKIFNSTFKVDESYRMHVTGSDVCNYFINWQGNYLKYGKHLGAARDKKYFEGDRIIIREIPGKTRILCAYTNDEYTVKNTAHVFIPSENVDAKYLTGILNSKLIGFYFVNKFSERDGVFPKAKIGQCRLLPVRLGNDAVQGQVIKLVDEILLLKSQDENSDISSIESELDRIVYHLYGLAEKEIQIIENS